MLAAVTRWPGREVVAVHRTFLCPEGTSKADVEPAKMSLGSIRGGSVRLAPAGEALAVAEGIETALSVQEGAGLPTWAALSAGGIESLILPALPLASEIFICADHDPVGLKAARKAAERWTAQGRLVRIARPPGKGRDFNDLLLEDADESQ